jgi:hypothetical protein
VSGQIYEVRPSRRRGRIRGCMALVFLAFAGLGVVEGRARATLVMLALALALVVWAIVTELREPYRIVVDDEALTLVSRTRRELVPWSHLAGVLVQPNQYGGRLIWVFADETGVTTPAAIPDLHRLLVEVERRAPQAQVKT